MSFFGSRPNFPPRSRRSAHWVVAAAVCTALFVVCGQSVAAQAIGRPAGTIRIATFNLRVFGVTKASHPAVMSVLADIIRHFDLVAIQEIRDASGTAIRKLMDDVNEGTDRYAIVLGPRVGRTQSKEQYGFIYDTRSIALAGAQYDFDDDGDGNGVNSLNDVGGNDLFEREPELAYFRAVGGTFDFVAVDIHTRPDDATREIGELPLVVADARSHYRESDVIVLGDFNADGSYFDESSYAKIFPPGQYIWVIPNDVDTSVARSSNTYDRFVLTSSSAEDYDGSYGVVHFPDIYDLPSLDLSPDDVSDHYPVWAEFFIDHDTD